MQHKLVLSEHPHSPQKALQQDATLIPDQPIETPEARTNSVEVQVADSPEAATLQLEPKQTYNFSSLTAEGSGQTAGRSIGALSNVGSHKILEKIGKGGMGVVFKAHDKDLNRTVALKMIVSGHFADSILEQRFNVEAQASAKLRHPNIVQIHEFGEHDGQHYFTMDFIDGGDLDDLVRETPLAPKKAASLVKKVAEAIHFAHESGVLHRDLKPANVLLDGFGEPMVADFGLAKLLEESSQITKSGDIMGTPSYMSPEQAAGEEIDRRSDIYSIGAILYKLLIGRPPFQAHNFVETLKQVRESPLAPLKQSNSSLPFALDMICQTCLKKDPAERYATARELADALGRYLSDEQATTATAVRQVTDEFGCIPGVADESDFIDIAEELKRQRYGLSTSPISPGDFFNGDRPKWADVIQGFVAPRDKAAELQEFLLKWLECPTGRTPVAVALGEPGCGKSTAIMQIAADLAESDHLVFFHRDQSPSLDANQLRRLAGGQPVFVFIDRLAPGIDPSTFAGFLQSLHREAVKSAIVVAAQPWAWPAYEPDHAASSPQEFDFDKWTDNDLNKYLDRIKDVSPESLGRLSDLSREQQLEAFDRVERSFLRAMLELKRSEVKPLNPMSKAS